MKFGKIKSKKDKVRKSVLFLYEFNMPSGGNPRLPPQTTNGLMKEVGFT